MYSATGAGAVCTAGICATDTLRLIRQARGFRGFMGFRGFRVQGKARTVNPPSCPLGVRFDVPDAMFRGVTDMCDGDKLIFVAPLSRVTFDVLVGRQGQEERAGDPLMPFLLASWSRHPLCSGKKRETRGRCLARGPTLASCRAMSNGVGSATWST